MTKRALQIVAVASVAITSMGCHLDMWNKSRLKPYEEYAFFDNGSSTRPLPEGTVPFGGAKIDEHLYKGTINGEFAKTYPFEITEDVIARGKDRYMVFCTPCHGYTGDGKGMIVQREMKEAASHTGDPRLLDPEQSPPGYFFDVITNGFGVMYPYATRIKAEDRWAIVAYIRALQLSQNITYSELSDEQKTEFDKQLAGDHSTEEAH